MSCCTGLGDPLHWPLMRRPRSSTNTEASPLRAWRSVTLAATVMPAAFTHGPVPMRERALVGPLPLSGSRSTLRYARQVFELKPTDAPRLWQSASAPRRPPRFPVTLVALVTKKLIDGEARLAGDGDVELALSPLHDDMRNADTTVATTA